MIIELGKVTQVTQNIGTDFGFDTAMRRLEE